MFEEANGLTERVKMDFSVQEVYFVRKLLAKREIPSPKLLIKDHKTINNKGGFQNRLVVPEIKCTATLSKLGYIKIKIIIYKAKLN